jgi:hypothetical protein
MTLRHWMISLLSVIFISGMFSTAKSAKREKNFFSLFEKEAPAYLFSYFTDNGEDGLHLMYSHDGIIWRTLNHGASLLKPTVGKEKLMRDPSIVKDAEGTFHMVWTTGWAGDNIGYATSKDLINWSEQKELPVMHDEPTCKNTWAPELYYDKLNRVFYIVWASTVPGRFPENDTIDGGYNHRLYYTTTQDFKKFTKTKLYYNPGFSVIDACFLKRRGRFYMFLKNETENPVEKNIRYVSSSSIKSFPKTVSEPISGKEWAEGPTAVQIGEYTYVYWDNYKNGHYGAVRCKGLRNPQWEDITNMIRFPLGVRHGTAFKVADNILLGLQNLDKK